VAHSADLPRLGLAITTIGRPAIVDLLESVARSSSYPAVVSIANQSGRPLLGVDPSAYPFPVVVVPSSGGVSRGRNDAVAALGQDVDVIGFPNDDSTYDVDTCRSVQRRFSRSPAPAALACRLVESNGIRFPLPPPGSPLNRRTVWRALEACTFIDRRCFDALGGFSLEIGSGGPTPWGSGEGTDLLLRVMACGGRVESQPGIVVYGTGERRQLDDDQLVAKHRAYARGTGHVYRVHRYPLSSRLRILAGPWAHPMRHDPDPRVSLRLAVARSVGRFEGLTGRILPSSGPAFHPEVPRP
jgi:hypothetical protein